MGTESTKTIKGRIINKHGTEESWILSVYTDLTKTKLRDNPFIPLDGELIIYDPDSIYTHRRIKIGDGKTYVTNLPFAADPYQTKTDGALATENKEIVGAINEIKYDIEDLLGTSLDYEDNSEENIVYSEGLEFNEHDDGYFCIGIGDCTDTDIVIPPIYNGKPVVAIDNDAFAWNSDITSIKVPNSVNRICDYAFAGCENVVNIIIPDSVTSMGYAALAECYALESITIPFARSYDEIQDWFDWGIPQEALTQVIIAGGESIGEDAFAGDWVNVVEIIIPDSVTNIGNSAFRDCYSLARIVIPKRVIEIGYNAFQDCDSLTIYCEAQRKPDDWHEDWNPSDCPVVWGYGIETLETEAQTVIGAINEINAKVGSGGDNIPYVETELDKNSTLTELHYELLGKSSVKAGHPCFLHCVAGTGSNFADAWVTMSDTFGGGLISISWVDFITSKSYQGIISISGLTIGAIVSKLAGEIPAYNTDTDEGKFFRIQSGVAGWYAVPKAEDHAF